MKIEILKLIVSLSLSGSILIGLILLLRTIFKMHLNKRWNYYIWLIAVLRLLLPVSHEHTVMNYLFSLKAASVQTQITNWLPLGEMVPLFLSIILFLWILVAVLLMTKKVTSYTSFARFVKSGRSSIDDPDTLNILSDVCEELWIKRPLELYLNPLISSPMMIGVLHPCIILPYLPDDPKELSYIIHHEAIHYKQRDSLYIWIIQLVLCLHWFNPLIYWLEVQVRKDREFACDEYLIQLLGPTHIKLYGSTLIKSLERSGSYKEKLVAITLQENPLELKERLEALSAYKEPAKKTVLFLLLIGSLLIASYYLGAYKADITMVKKKELTTDRTPVTEPAPPETQTAKQPIDTIIFNEEINEIDIHTAGLSVFIVKGEHYSIEIDPAINDIVTYEIESGTLKLHDRKLKAGNDDYYLKEDTAVIVSIPENDRQIPDLTINDTDTMIQVSDVTVNHLYLTGDCLDIKLFNITAQSLYADSNDSRISLNNCTVMGKAGYNGSGTDLELADSQIFQLDLQGNLADLKMKNCWGESSYDINYDISDLIIENIRPAELMIKAETSDVTIKKCTAELITINSGGTVELIDSISDVLNLTQGTGSLETENCTVHSVLTATAELGKIIFWGTVSGNIDIISRDLGTIQINLPDPQTNWQIGADCTYDNSLTKFLIDRQEHSYPYAFGNAPQKITIVDYNSVGQFVELIFTP